MSIKIYFTAIESRPDGSAVTLFEDYKLQFEDEMLLGVDDSIGYKLAQKIGEVQLINEQASSPL